MTLRVPSWTKTLRSVIPVRDRIHSSEVSWTLSRSTLVMSVWGAADPMPMGRTDILPPDAIERADDDKWGTSPLLLPCIEKADAVLPLRRAMDANRSFILLLYCWYNAIQYSVVLRRLQREIKASWSTATTKQSQFLFYGSCRPSSSTLEDTEDT